MHADSGVTLLLLLSTGVCAVVGAITIWQAIMRWIRVRVEKAYAKRTAQVYQEILSEKFPGVQVRYEGYGDGLRVSVYMIPDGIGRVFMDFVLNELPELLDVKGLQFVGVMPVHVASTKKYYPELYKEFIKCATKI